MNTLSTSTLSSSESAILRLQNVGPVRLSTSVLVGNSGVSGYIDALLPNRIIVCAHQSSVFDAAVAECDHISNNDDVLAFESLSLYVEGDLNMALGLKVLWESRQRLWTPESYWWSVLRKQCQQSTQGEHIFTW